MIDFSRLKSIISNNKSFLLTTHVNPDADAIGSEIAFYLLLKALGKTVYIINYSSTPYNLEFLDSGKNIEKYDPGKHDPIFNSVDVLTAIDFNNSNRMVKMAKSFIEASTVKLCIDHHQESEHFADYFFTDTSYCATGQIIYELIKKTGIIPLNYNIAYPIYAAIMTDTGSFRFGRTTPEIHHIAAELIGLGVIPGEVYDKIFDQSKFSKVKLLGKALDSMQLYGDKHEISFIVLKYNIFKELKAIESDTDGIVNFTLSIEGVKIGLMFVELKDGFKVSFRSKGNIPVNKLAAEFGGGGHINAAGARIFKNNLEDYLPKVLIVAENYLNKY